MKQEAWRIAVAAMLGISAAGALRADPRLGEQKDPSVRQSDWRSVFAAHDYMACIVHHRKDLAERFLDATDPQVSGKLGFDTFRHVECSNLANAAGGISRSIAMPPDQMRGMLAEALLVDAGRPALVPLPPEKSYRRDWFPVSERPPEIDEMAVCVTDADPQDVRSLLLSNPESVAETTAMQAVAPTLGSCLLNGAKLHANRQSLRGALAEAYYHRWRSPNTAVAVSQ